MRLLARHTAKLSPQNNTASFLLTNLTQHLTNLSKPAALNLQNTVRPFSSIPSSGLKERLAEIIPREQERLKRIKNELGERSLGEVTVEQCIGGARGVKCILYETSLLDPIEGIRFRGLSIPELQQKLPKFLDGEKKQPTPEALLWLLLTGEIPTKAQVSAVTEELSARSSLPSHIEPLLRSLPKDMHPMTKFAMAVLAMQTESKFAKAYSEGTNKKDYWQPTYEDTLDLIARLPEVAALIYRTSFKDGVLGEKDENLDYSANLARLLGFDTKQFAGDLKKSESFEELMRIYLVIHADHEGGNASAHATHLVGSTLSDPYLSFSAGLNALAGPLHGLANQEVLNWILQLQRDLKAENKEVTKESIKEYTWKTLKAGRVIPGYGHGVLRNTDPRYLAQREFALQYLPKDPLFHIVGTIFEVVPDVLMEHGKTKNPWPNVDSHSGVLLVHYGLTEQSFYTVLFGVSRAFGALSQVVWDRALGMPLERPKSVTSKWIEDHFAEKDKKSKL